MVKEYLLDIAGDEESKKGQDCLSNAGANAVNVLSNERIVGGREVFTKMPMSNVVGLERAYRKLAAIGRIPRLRVDEIESFDDVAINLRGDNGIILTVSWPRLYRNWLTTEAIREQSYIKRMRLMFQRIIAHSIILLDISEGDVLVYDYNFPNEQYYPAEELRSAYRGAYKIIYA